MENAACRVAFWPERGAALVSYVDRASGIDVIWRNPQVDPRASRLLDQPMAGGSDLYDIMDGSWYVSLPNGFFAGDYFGAPLGTHGELRAVPWEVTRIVTRPEAVTVSLVGRSVRTPLVYHRELVLGRTSPLLQWRETLENRWSEPLPVAWLHHPTFSGPLLDGAELVVPASRVQVYAAPDPSALQLQAGYDGRWPLVPERGGGAVRDCSQVPPAGTGWEQAVQISGFAAGWGNLWNAPLGLGFAMMWDPAVFPYAWSWCNTGGLTGYPLWGEGRVFTLQPSTSPVGRFPDLRQAGALLTVPAKGRVSTTLTTGFVLTRSGPWGREGGA